MELKNIDLTNKCGSCDYFNPIDGTAMGECRKNPYDENVVHDPKHHYLIVVRSKIKCRHYNKPQPTNADRIRAMSDEELAKHLHDIGWDCHLCAEHRRLDNEPLLRGEKCDEKCVQHCLEWLKQPVEVSNNA